MKGMASCLPSAANFSLGLLSITCLRPSDVGQEAPDLEIPVISHKLQTVHGTADAHMCTVPWKVKGMK